MKTILVSWSGGLDSTYLIYDYLKKGHIVKAFYTKLINNDNKVAFELDAIKKLSQQFTAEFGDMFIFYKESSEFMIATPSGKNDIVLSQPPIWLLSLLFILNKGIDEVAIGYVMNDCAISFLQDIQRVYKAYQPFFRNKLPKLIFPLTKLTKDSLYEQLPKNYYENTVTCEQPLITSNGTYVPCYNCIPCKHKMEFDSAYTNIIPTLPSSPVEWGSKVQVVKKLNQHYLTSIKENLI